MGKRGPKPKNVDTTWASELAYVVGMFASDGNLGKDGMYLDVTSADIETIVTVKEILKLDNIKVGTKNNGSTYRLQFKRILFHQWLQSIGLTPDKSRTIGQLDIPDRYFFDFFRGVWDGDGCIYSYFDPRWKSSFMFYISIASASPNFLIWLQESIERLIGTKGKITVGSKNTEQLRFAKRDSRVLFAAMFYKKGLPHLPRKFAKAQEIFRIDEANDKDRLAR
jgi:hypothetical protein